MASEDRDKIKVAVVGTGMAGLVVAYLLNQDKRKRYDVHVFESGPAPSLDSASVSVLDRNGQTTRIDVPMRALTSGYYPNLRSMYDFLGVRYRAQRLRFIFSKQSGFLDDRRVGQPYFVHASNNHEFPPSQPSNVSISEYLIELCFVAVCYIWFTVCCFLFVPSKSRHVPESVGEYLARIWLPNRFTSYYLLPLMSAVATCSHEELLNFPASDIIDYRKAILFGEHLVVSEGVQKVQAELTKGLTMNTMSPVSAVCSGDAGVRISVRGQQERLYDHVVLAVPPNVAASIFQPVRKQLDPIPTRTVTTVIHRSPMNDEKSDPRAEDIFLCTTEDGWTHASHCHGGGITVTSNCGGGPLLTDSLSSSCFTRTLRTPQSKVVVESMFENKGRASSIDEKQNGWRNGEQNVWMVGAWCWDGMVLLEGAAVSAIRVAQAFGITIPWEQTL